MNRLLPSVIKRSILVNSRLHSTMAQSFLVTKNMDTKYFEKVANKFTMDMWQHSHDIPRQDLLERVKGKTAIFCTLTDKIDGQLLDAAGPQLKVVSTLSAGYDHIDLDECRKRNILVANTPDVLTDAVAELTISLLLATLRRLFEANRALREGKWPKGWAHFFMCGGMVKKSTLGFIGSGRIGLSILKRLQAFEPEKILYHSRNHSQKFDSNGAIYSSFEELLTKSDIIIVICSLNPSTRNLLGAKQFAIMKKNAVVINTSRGAVIDQKALYEALKNKQIGAAGLDVFETEPIPLDDPLLELDNAVLLPHIGSASQAVREEMIEMACDNLEAGLEGRPPKAQVV